MGRGYVMEVEMLKFRTSQMRPLLAYALPASVIMIMSELDRLLFCGEQWNPQASLCSALYANETKSKAYHLEPIGINV